MDSVQRSTFYASDYQQYSNEYKNTAYLQDPKAIGKISKRPTSNGYKNGKMLNRRLRSGHSNNRPNLSVYSSSQNFVDPFYTSQKRKAQGGNRGKSLRNKGKDRFQGKPYTAQQEKRNKHLNEQTSDTNLKESYVATIKQTIEKEENRLNDTSNISDKPVVKGQLPLVNHEESKRKIEDLIYKAPVEDTGNEIFIKKHESMKYHDMNGPETNLNEMPDLTTFDDRKGSDLNSLINNKMNGGAKQSMPNKSMRNLNKNGQDVLPIYKRRAYNKGPIKIGDRSYIQRPLKTHYSSKRQNTWIKEQMNMSGDENTNQLNQNQPVKARVVRSGRRPNEFRINK